MCLKIHLPHLGLEAPPSPLKGVIVWQSDLSYLRLQSFKFFQNFDAKLFWRLSLNKKFDTTRFPLSNYYLNILLIQCKGFSRTMVKIFTEHSFCFSFSLRKKIRFSLIRSSSHPSKTTGDDYRNLQQIVSVLRHPKEEKI